MWFQKVHREGPRLSIYGYDSFEVEKGPVGGPPFSCAYRSGVVRFAGLPVARPDQGSVDTVRLGALRPVHLGPGSVAVVRLGPVRFGHLAFDHPDYSGSVCLEGLADRPDFAIPFQSFVARL